MGENVVEYLGGGDDATGDVGKGIETLAEIFTQEVVGDVHLKAIENARDALQGLLERGIVTGGGDDGVVFAYLGNVGLGIDGRGELVHSLAVKGADGESGEGE